MRKRSSLRRSPRLRSPLRLAVFLSGTGGLTWEVLWQHHASLSLGVSAYGTAVTLAALMLGMGLGGYGAAWLADRHPRVSFMRAYSVAELVIGVGGLSVVPLIAGLQYLDTRLYLASASAAAVVHVVGIAVSLLLPSAAMGATLPLLAPAAQRSGSSLSLLYAINLAGALVGVLLATFVALPALGVTATAWCAAGINAAVAAWVFRQSHLEAPHVEVGAAAAAAASSREPMVSGVAGSRGHANWPSPSVLLVAFSSAFVVFALEVSWFRSLRAAFQSTTETFATIVGAFLLSLAAGGALAAWLRPRAPRALPTLLAAGAVATLIVTPHVDQIDRSIARASELMASPHWRFLATLQWVAVPVTLLGTWFPWVLGAHSTPQGAGRLYAVNTLGAIAGALLAGFVLLPAVGSSATSWVAASLGMALALVQHRGLGARTLLAGAAGLSVLYVGLVHDGGARARVQGFQSHRYGPASFTSEGPDTTVWVAPDRYDDDRPALIIDGFEAAAEGPGASYMAWMGHLPALATPEVREGLVICFGTGQTANALAQHASALTIVDVNPAVFAAGHLFSSNQRVLERDHVEHVVMDGRAYLRRHVERRFDVITLEPLPPNFAGANNLYSVEFYALARSRLTASGTTAQWVPFHLLSPSHVRGIVAAFTRVFEHARLWISHHGTGILIGSQRPLTLHQLDTPLPLEEVERAFVLDGPQLLALAGDASPVTDDNQLLAYGLDRLRRAGGVAHATQRLQRTNLALVESLQSGGGHLRRAAR